MSRHEHLPVVSDEHLGVGHAAPPQRAVLSSILVEESNRSTLGGLENNHLAPCAVRFPTLQRRMSFGPRHRPERTILHSGQIAAFIKGAPDLCRRYSLRRSGPTNG